MAILKKAIPASNDIKMAKMATWPTLFLRARPIFPCLRARPSYIWCGMRQLSSRARPSCNGVSYGFSCTYRDTRPAVSLVSSL